MFRRGSHSQLVVICGFILHVAVPKYVKFVDALFDTNNGSTVYFHNTIQDFSSSVDAHLPQTSLMLPANQDGTDIFQVLDYFLNNTGSDGCGSYAVILVKRLPFGYPPFPRIPELQQKKIRVNFIQSNYVLHSGNVFPLSDLAGNSGGLLVYAGEANSKGDVVFSNVTQVLMDVPYTDNLLYDYTLDAYNNFTNQKLARKMKIPRYSNPVVNLTLAVTTGFFEGPHFHMQSLTLKFVNTVTSAAKTLTYTPDDYYLSTTDLILKSVQFESGADYDVYVSCQRDFSIYVMIRLYIDKPIPDNWTL